MIFSSSLFLHVAAAAAAAQCSSSLLCPLIWQAWLNWWFERGREKRKEKNGKEKDKKVIMIMAISSSRAKKLFKPFISNACMYYASNGMGTISIHTEEVRQYLSYKESGQTSFLGAAAA